MKPRAINPWAVIAAILLLTVVIAFFWRRGLPVLVEARRGQCRAFLRSLETALKAYQLDNGDYPDPLGSNLAILGQPHRRHGPY
ncbi:MAG TPA: hypothetical protein VK661_06530, partial [Planctomycetota bacterium]|nr:hypothetical protein [Planctomycetota bacterium]